MPRTSGPPPEDDDQIGPPPAAADRAAASGRFGAEGESASPERVAAAEPVGGDSVELASGPGREVLPVGTGPDADGDSEAGDSGLGERDAAGQGGSGSGAGTASHSAIVPVAATPGGANGIAGAGRTARAVETGRALATTVGGTVGVASKRTAARAAARTAELSTVAVATLTGPQARALTTEGARRTAQGAWLTARGLGWLARRVLPLDQPLLREEAFRFFWFSRVAAQTAQGALLYALLIVVADRTDASFYNALFVACSIVSSIVFGLPAGIVVDALPRRPLMVGLNLVRFAFVVALLLSDPTLGGIFAATLGIWVIHQFYSPSESAVVAALVPPGRYASAQALSNLALTLAQSLGLILLAPVLLKLAGPRALYAVVAALFFAAALFCALLPRLDDHLRAAPVSAGGRAGVGERRPAGASGGRPVRSFGSARAALLVGWRTVRGDRVAYEALADDMLVGIGMSSLVVIMPIYLERVLGTSKENTVFVFAPAALGLVVGLRLAPRLAAGFGERRAATGALAVFAATIAAFGFVEGLEGAFERVGLPVDRLSDLAGISPLVLIAMWLSIPAGLASAVVGVATRAVLLNRTPAAARGQVIATQNLIGNLAALVPTLLTGIAADLIGIEPIAVVIAVVIAGGAVWAHTAAGRPAPVAQGSMP